jgi:hypothetical protein
LIFAFLPETISGAKMVLDFSAEVRVNAAPTFHMEYAT